MARRKQRMSKKERQQREAGGDPVVKVEPSQKYILEPGREFYLLTCDDEGKEDNSNVLAVDMMSLTIFMLDLANRTYLPFEAEEVVIKSVGRQKHVELFIKNGRYTGNYSVSWRTDSGELKKPDLVTSHTRTQIHS